MMRDTPRTFVGSVVFLLESPVPAEVADLVCADLSRLPGISRCDLDAAAGSLLVSAEAPIDRSDILEVLDRLGCRVHP
jgi:hypothetical protein